MSGRPDAASMILASSNLDELAARTEYLDRIESSDSELAAGSRKSATRSSTGSNGSRR